MDLQLESPSYVFVLFGLGVLNNAGFDGRPRPRQNSLLELAGDFILT